jgi:hypothetical protein
MLLIMPGTHIARFGVSSQFHDSARGHSAEAEEKRVQVFWLLALNIHRHKEQELAAQDVYKVQSLFDIYDF